MQLTKASSSLGASARLIQHWLDRQLDDQSLLWLSQSISEIAGGASERLLFARFSAASRRLGKDDLAIAEADLQAAQRVFQGWSPRHWSIDQAGRTLLLLALPAEDANAFVGAIETLFSAADVGELVALYQALPLLPYPERFLNLAIDGVRSNMTAVFNAIALQNPYPAEHFNDDAWNQVVLKALFVGSSLHLMIGLDQRANAKLARMLSDYAHERWAAGRSVNPELWRVVGPFAEGVLVADLEQVLASADEREQLAAALACACSPAHEAQALLDTVPSLKSRIRSGELTWANLH